MVKKQIYVNKIMRRHFYKTIFSTNNLLKIGNSLYIILTSIYDIKEDVTKLKKEHGLLFVGIVLLIKTTKEVVEKIKELKAITKK
jgi:hypothetical protein